MTATHVCPASHAGFLDNGLRKLVHNPYKILKPYIHMGMNVADIGCGPGFFTIPLAEMVGQDGVVYSYDLQQEMLDKVAKKIDGTPLESVISFHQCQEKGINFLASVDFVLGFYMVHEVPDVAGLLREISAALNPGGIFLMVEPLFHVSLKKFGEVCGMAEKAGFVVKDNPRVFFGRSVVLQKL